MNNEVQYHKKYRCYICEEKDSERKYEKVNILSENGDSIFSPEHEQNHDGYGPRRGQLYFSADLILKLVLGVPTFHKGDY